MNKWMLAGMGLLALLLVDSAAAADLPVEPAPVAVPYTAPEEYVPWSGLYVGGHIGGATTNWRYQEFDEVALPAPAPPPSPPILLETNSFHSSGLIGGPQMGGNLQLYQRFLIGVEGDVSALLLRADTTFFQSIPGFTNVVSGQVGHHFQMPWFATGRARAGVTFTNFLLYGTAGTVISDQTIRRSQLTGQTNLAIAQPGPPPVPFVETAITTNAYGWTAGGGVEWAFTRELSVKFEYLHLWIGPTTFNFPVSGTSLVSRVGIDTLRIGFNWKFLGSDF